MSKNSLFDAIKEDNNLTETTNGMIANKSTLSAVLDLFGAGAACRKDKEALEKYVLKAYLEDKTMCLRTLFYFRDIRGNSGQGERDIFRWGLRAIASVDFVAVCNVLKHVPFYGRWDDVIAMIGVCPQLDTQVKAMLMSQLGADNEALKNKEFDKISLLAKWMPSMNATSKETRKMGKIVSEMLGMTPRNYRKMLSALRKALNVVECKISKKQYDFDYSKIPGAAMKKYEAAFKRNDTERWVDYLGKLRAVTSMAYNSASTTAKDFGYTEEELAGVKANTKNLYPYEIVKSVWETAGNYFQDPADVDADKLSMLDSMWKNQKDYFTGDSANENWLAVSDVSGSMYGMPICVSISLAMYIAEHNKGYFKDRYMTYSAYPQLIEIDRDWPIDKKVKMISNADVGYNTDLIKVFDTILDAAVSHKIPESEMPSTVVIISDMQFDDHQMANTDGRSISIIRHKYAEAGYTMPKLVYWNAAQSDYGNVPITTNDRGVMLLSGCKPGMFEQMVSCGSPLEFMLSVINSERYEQIIV